MRAHVDMAPTARVSWARRGRPRRPPGPREANSPHGWREPAQLSAADSGDGDGMHACAARRQRQRQRVNCVDPGAGHSIGRFPDGDCPSPALSAPEEIRSRSRSLCPPRGAAAASRHGAVAVAVCVTRGRVPPALIVDGSFSFLFSLCNLVMQFRLGFYLQ